MIELVSDDRCIDCNLCVKVCPTNVFDPVPEGHPVIARQSDCQTCYLCEAYCPVDALFVAPMIEPLPIGSSLLDERHLVATGLLGRYRRDLGWRPGDEPTVAQERSRRLYEEMHTEPPPSRLPPPAPYRPIEDRVPT